MSSRGQRPRKRRPLSPFPSPAPRERGAEGGMRAGRPRAYALGYSIPPLTGLQKTAEAETNFVNGLVSRSTGMAEITVMVAKI